MPYEAAAEMEKDLAEDLRRAGCTVTGGHQTASRMHTRMIWSSEK